MLSRTKDCLWRNSCNESDYWSFCQTRGGQNSLADFRHLTFWLKPSRLLLLGKEEKTEERWSVPNYVLRGALLLLGESGYWRVCLEWSLTTGVRGAPAKWSQKTQFCPCHIQKSCTKHLPQEFLFMNKIRTKMGCFGIIARKRDIQPVKWKCSFCPLPNKRKSLDQLNCEMNLQLRKVYSCWFRSC